MTAKLFVSRLFFASGPMNEPVAYVFSACRASLPIIAALNIILPSNRTVLPPGVCRKPHLPIRCRAIHLTMRIILGLLISFWLAAHTAAAEPSALEHLKIFLTGSFSNSAQARGDQNFRNTTLHGAPIWTDRGDGPWLYLEQALADAPKHPFRQLVFQLVAREDGTLGVRIHDLADPIAATGAWQEPARLAQLSPADLVLRPDCSLILRLHPGGSFTGGTESKGCASTLPGAAYSTMKTVITNLQIMIWERGYNASDVQVWGSIHGGYEFKRVE
jgi:CpeT protein